MDIKNLIHDKMQFPWYFIPIENQVLFCVYFGFNILVWVTNGLRTLKGAMVV